MGNSVECISYNYNCVLFSCSQGRAESGELLPLFFQKGGNGCGAVAIPREGLGGPWPTDFCLAPQFIS